MRLLSFLFLLTALSSCTQKEKTLTRILPEVQEARHAPSYFNLEDVALYALPNAQSAAQLLALELEKLDYATDTILPFKDPIQSNSINLHIDSTLHQNKAYYELTVQRDFIFINAVSYQGLVHGIYSLLQLIPRSSGINDSKLACITVKDYPHFKWRGMLLDCCRHFMEVDFIKRYIDLLAYHKMNVLHWHLTEDQGWRIESKKHPKLTEIGAWRKQKDGSTYGGFYTKQQIKEVVAYAKQRGVAVVPEIELPGHSLAALAAYPEFSCTGGPFEVTNDWGVFKDIYCAGNDSTFAFLEQVLDEVIDLFPSEYIHIGGDESPKYRWDNCLKCLKRITDEGLANSHELQSYFIQRIENYVHSKGKKIIGWDEILEGGLAQNATVQSWRGFEGAAQAAKTGHDAIVSPTSHAYFDYGLEAIDLKKVYEFDPVPDGLTPQEAHYIIGGECNMWTERAPQSTIDSKVFPRLLALSEILWTYPKERDYKAFYQKVQGHYKRLDQLGVDYGLETVPVQYTTRYQNQQFKTTLTPGAKELSLYYSVNGSEPLVYDTTFTLSGSNSIQAWATKNQKPYGTAIEVDLYQHKGLDASITDLNEYANAYTGGGNRAVVDGIRGSVNFRDGSWQGYSGKDFFATLGFESPQTLEHLVLSFFQYNLSWIFLPPKITIYTSMDGESYYNRGELLTAVSPKKEGQFFEEFEINFPKVEARFVKVKAQNFGKCPPWHPAAGAPAWLFVDELRLY